MRVKSDFLYLSSYHWRLEEFINYFYSIILSKELKVEVEFKLNHYVHLVIPLMIRDLINYNNVLIRAFDA